MPADAVLAPYLDAIEQALREALTTTDEALQPLYAMMQYHLGWRDEALAPVKAPRGKRLRPLICVLSDQAAGGDWHKALPAAAALEIIHNFSLIHDDIEDDSSTRRHRPTVWKLWGIAQGINTGDAMWGVAHLTLCQLQETGLAAGDILAVMHEIDDAFLQLCHGQYLDISFESRSDVSLAEYQHMIAGKTAALLAASAASGALCARSDAVEHYRAYGRQLGLAFQIQDDILGIWGEPALTGKSAADDVLHRKKTFPILYAQLWEKEHGLAELSCLYSQPASADVLDNILFCLERAGAQEAAQQQVTLYLHAALNELELSGARQPALGALRDVTLSLVQRVS